MKKPISCVWVFLIIATTTSFRPVPVNEPSSTNSVDRIEDYISRLYKQIDFGESQPLSYEVFNKALHGYFNLHNAGKLGHGKEIISVCDFQLPSTEKRLWIIDLLNKKVLFNTLVAHGQGSGENFAFAFSNNFDSHQTSVGFYVTGDTYDGDHGTSLCLHGMDADYNDAAFDRGIVVHGASYVSEKFINNNNHLGRSWGCPAVPSELSLPIINTIKDSTCLFIYYPLKTYLETAFWLNQKIDGLPGNFLENNLDSKLAGNEISKPRMTTIRYVNNKGETDSVKTIPYAQQNTEK
jgi:hypothetical protein